MTPMPMLALAPMEGFADAVVRALMARLGGIDYVVTEFVRVGGIPLSATNLLRRCPELGTGAPFAAGVPVHVQLLGADPELMARAATLAGESGALVVDLNFGCPVKRVNGHGGGAALLKRPRAIERITQAVRQALPESVHVSAKLRLGWSDPREAITVAKAAQDGGASWVTIHGRTRAQGYAGRADWDRIGQVRSALRIPVVANGDICTPLDLQVCRERTGCDRFLIGRGVLARPELFRVLRGLDAGWWAAWKRLELLVEFARLRRQIDEPEAYTLGRLKNWTRAMGTEEPDIARVFDAIKADSSLWDALQEVQEASRRGRARDTATQEPQSVGAFTCGL